MREWSSQLLDWSLIVLSYNYINKKVNVIVAIIIIILYLIAYLTLKLKALQPFCLDQLGRPNRQHPVTSGCDCD